MNERQDLARDRRGARRHALESKRILDPGTDERFLFGCLVKNQTCFDLMVEGARGYLAVRRRHRHGLYAADEATRSHPISPSPSSRRRSAPSITPTAERNEKMKKQDYLIIWLAYSATRSPGNPGVVIQEAAFPRARPRSLALPDHRRRAGEDRRRDHRFEGDEDARHQLHDSAQAGGDPYLDKIAPSAKLIGARTP